MKQERIYQKYKDIYKLIIKTSQEPSDTNNIFLFTAERAIEYPYFTSIDFLVIDEFYKLSANVMMVGLHL